MGLGYKVTSISCVVILLVTILSYPTVTPNLAYGTNEGEIVAIELSPPAGEKHWVTIRNGYSYAYSFKGWSIVTSIGKIFSLSDSIIQPGQSLSFGTYNMFMACEDKVELRNSANIVVDTVGNLCDFDNDDSYWYKPFDGKWKFTGPEKSSDYSAPTTNVSIKISTDKLVYNEEERICVDGEGVPKGWFLPALKLFSGDGAYYGAEFPEINDGKFRRCFTPIHYSSNFSYGVWLVNFDYLDKTYAKADFAIIPVKGEEKDAGELINVTKEESGNPVVKELQLFKKICINGKTNVRDGWSVILTLWNDKDEIVDFGVVKVTSKSFSICGDKYPDVGKVALEPIRKLTS